MTDEIRPQQSVTLGLVDWKIVDHTSAKAGYLRLMFRDQRVCDFFPFAANTNTAWVREQAELIAKTMNEKPTD